MKKYDYRAAICDDIRTYIEDNEIDTTENGFDDLYDDLFCEDSVTGNGSGSYTFNASEAEENLDGNMDILRDALEVFGYNYASATDYYLYKKGAEWCDVTIRCHLLGECLEKVLNEYNN